jgi:hypothetical protein
MTSDRGCLDLFTPEEMPSKPVWDLCRVTGGTEGVKDQHIWPSGPFLRQLLTVLAFLQPRANAKHRRLVSFKPALSLTFNIDTPKLFASVANLGQHDHRQPCRPGYSVSVSCLFHLTYESLSCTLVLRAFPIGKVIHYPTFHMTSASLYHSGLSYLLWDMIAND